MIAELRAYSIAVSNKNRYTEISLPLDAKIETINQCVCTVFGLPFERLFEKTRKREVVQARQVCIYFVKDNTKISLKEIGRKFGGIDHATVIHAIKQVGNLMFSDKNYREKIIACENLIDFEI